jgi:hypothetical protein
MHDNQVFQDWIFLVDGRDEPLEIRSRQLKADTMDAITLPESQDCSLFLFCGEVMKCGIMMKVPVIIDDDWKRR